MASNVNMSVWDALSVTDPSQTKGFKRSGGFSGTAIKPMWVWKRLTETFGPMGSGWGCSEPSFQVVHGHNNEVLVYCTVSAWHHNDKKPDGRAILFGVGGDKVVTHIKANDQYKKPERWENDDEAFKKAFTDALMNAFKFIGVAADVHMGLFDDNKYVQQAAKHFAEPAPEKTTSAEAKRDDLWNTIQDKFIAAKDYADLTSRFEYFKAKVPAGWQESLSDMYDDHVTRLAEASQTK